MSDDSPPLPEAAVLRAAAEAAAALHGVAVDPAWMPTVVSSLAAVAKAAQLVESFPLRDEAEFAPVFRA